MIKPRWGLLMGKVISIRQYLEKKSAIAEICIPPPHKFRVVKHGGKTWDYCVVDDYDSRFEALSCAREFTRKAKMRLSPLRFSAYDDRGRYLGGMA